MAFITTPVWTNPVRQGETVQAQRRIFFMVYNSTGTAEASSITWGANDVKLSLNGGAGVSSTNTPVAADATNNPGLYYLNLSAAEAATAGVLAARITNSGISTTTILAAVTRDASVLQGVAQAGAAWTITLDAGSSSTDRTYMGNYVLITSGTGQGQCRQVVYYAGSTKVATIFPAWDTQPTSSSSYIMLAGQFPANWDRVGLATGGSSSSITLDAGANATDGYYFNNLIGIIAGTGAGSSAQLVNAYSGSTKVVNTSMNWNAVPDATSVYVIVKDTGQLSGGAITANTFAAAAITSSVIASGAFTTAKYASGSLTAALFGNDTTIKASQNGTAQSGSTSTTIKIAAAAMATADAYKGCRVQIVSGTGTGQARTIVAYDGTTKIATVNRAWAVTPDATSVYTIHPADEFQIASDQAATALLVFTQSASAAVGGAGSVGEQVIVPITSTGTAVTGTLGAQTFSTSLSPTTNAFYNQFLCWLSGALAGQSQPVQSVTSGGVFTMLVPFTGAPSNGDRFILIGK